MFESSWSKHLTGHFKNINKIKEWILFSKAVMNFEILSQLINCFIYKTFYVKED